MSASRTAKRHMNLMSVVVFVLCLLLVSSNTVFAEPYLQLDADPAVYIGEDVVTLGNVFTLYALVNSAAGDAPADWLTKNYFLSIALIPDPGESSPKPDLGYFMFDSDTINVTADMQYGIPPITIEINKTLPSHEVFETYFLEKGFTLSGAIQTDVYNVALNPGGPGDPSSGDLYYRSFEVDASGLDFGYYLHFDLYTGVGDKIKFAPPSHDLTHAPVPGAVLLGLLGMGVAGVKLRKFA